jgi:hypothetical protein
VSGQTSNGCDSVPGNRNGNGIIDRPGNRNGNGIIDRAGNVIDDSVIDRAGNVIDDGVTDRADNYSNGMLPLQPGKTRMPPMVPVSPNPPRITVPSNGREPSASSNYYGFQKRQPGVKKAANRNQQFVTPYVAPIVK